MPRPPNWELIKAAAEELTAQGSAPFTRSQLIQAVQAKHPDRERNSLDPIIQGMTVNLKGGAPGAVGRECLRSVGRGLFILDGQPMLSPSGTGQRSSPPVAAPHWPQAAQGTGRTIVLVGCVKSKQRKAVPAKDLYTSDLFVARRHFAERFGDQWFILSALHGLVDPEQSLAHYEQVLTTRERRPWAERVFKALQPQLQEGDRMLLQAGERYRKYLFPQLQQAGYEVEVVFRDVPGIQVQVRLLNEAVERGHW